MLLWSNISSSTSRASGQRALQMSSLWKGIWFRPGPARACLELASQMLRWKTVCLQWHVSSMWSLLLDGSTGPTAPEVNPWQSARLFGLSYGVLWSAASTDPSHKTTWSSRFSSPPTECHVWAPWKANGTYMATLSSATTGPMWYSLDGTGVSYNGRPGHDRLLWRRGLPSYTAMVPGRTPWCGRVGERMARDFRELPGWQNCYDRLLALGALQDVWCHLYVDRPGWHWAGGQLISNYSGALSNLEPVVWAWRHSQSTSSSSRAYTYSTYPTQESCSSHGTWAHCRPSPRAEHSAATSRGCMVQQSDFTEGSTATAWWARTMLLGGDAHVRRAAQRWGLQLLGTSAQTTVLCWRRLRSAGVVSGHRSGPYPWQHG